MEQLASIFENGSAPCAKNSGNSTPIRPHIFGGCIRKRRHYGGDKRDNRLGQEEATEASEAPESILARTATPKTFVIAIDGWAVATLRRQIPGGGIRKERHYGIGNSGAGVCPSSSPGCVGDDGCDFRENGHCHAVLDEKTAGI